MPELHAKLSSSASKRWLGCPGSVKLSEHYPNGSSIYADEGTIAHGMAEGMISKDDKLVQKYEVEAAKFYGEHPELNGTFLEMKMILQPYVDYVFEEYAAQVHEDEAAQLMTEERVDLTEYIPGGFGTSDVVILRQGRLHIIDLKYGKGVAVSAQDNPQLKLYALGTLARFDMLYDIEDVVMTIYQPRLDNVSTDTIKAKDLYAWGEEVIKPGAQLALSEDAPVHAGDWCQFCPARYDCKERARDAMELQKYLGQMVLSPEEIAEILGKIDRLVKFAEDIKDSALTKALDGEEIPGWKVVEGRSNRKYVGSEEEIVRQCEGAGYDQALLYERKLLTITNMEKLMGKKQFAEVLGAYVEKPEGKPTLAPESDKRPAITNNSAAEDFADED
ncbi:MAG: DUF2800 domain-containing protein [Bacteroidales bacterium]|nr:DUF2800 domain-containing protein [Candidatus Liminaster caballi]